MENNDPQTNTTPISASSTPIVTISSATEKKTTSTRPLLIVFIVLLILSVAGLACYIIFFLRPFAVAAQPTTSVPTIISSSADARDRLSLAIRDAAYTGSSENVNAAADSVLDAVSNSVDLTNLRLYAVYLLTALDYSGDASSRLIALQTDTSVSPSPSELCSVRDLQYLLARHSNADTLDGYLNDRSQACSGLFVSGDYARVADETDLAYAKRLFEAGFYSESVAIFANILSSSSLSSAEYLYVLGVLRDYYSVVNDSASLNAIEERYTNAF